jgi:DNA-binding beta-propeller fold protein YncE
MRTPGLIAIALFVLLPLLVRAQQTETLADSVYFTSYTVENGVGGKLLAPIGIYCDQNTDEVFVTAGKRIIIYDRGLNIKYTIDHFVTDPMTGRMVPGEPRSVAVDPDGNIYVADNLADYVDFLDFRGQPIARVYPNRLVNDTTLKLRPEVVSIDESGNIYISVAGDMQTVLVLDTDQKFIRQIGQKGDRPQDFNTQVGMSAQHGFVCVTDLYAMPAVKVYDTLGEFQFGWGGHNVDREDFSLPSGVAIHKNEHGLVRFWIADALRHVIKVFSDQGEFVANIGGYGERIGEFTYPVGVSVGTRNTFFVCEKVLGRVQRLEIK